MKKFKKLNARQKAARRTAAGGFTKVIFNRIGGKECPPVRRDDLERTRLHYRSDFPWLLSH
jgi:hypothetical protein